MSRYNQSNGTNVTVTEDHMNITWKADPASEGQLVIGLKKDQPLFKSIGVKKDNAFREIASNLDPVFLLTVGKRNLKQPTQWTIFFDNPPRRPYDTYKLQLDKNKAAVVSEGSRTYIYISGIKGGSFSGDLKITLFNGTPLMKIAAVVSTSKDSAAIIYDAGLVNNTPWDKDRWNNINPWERIFWADPDDHPQQVERLGDPMRSTAVAVKYRTIIGQSKEGAIALFPPPHQYFFPEDNCYNLKFTWYGRNYHDLIPRFGLGIRQEPEGDKRFVPWVNAPPGTKQHLSFFCLLSTGDGPATLEKVKAYTHGDQYQPLPGYHTFASHYHIEPEMDVLTGKPLPAVDGFAEAFKKAGVDILHLASFHGPGHPEGPDSLRLHELKTSFDLCRLLSDDRFLLLPGEEPNHFLGGHWISFFPHPVYWIMSRQEGQPFVKTDAAYGRIYHIGDKNDMLRLLEAEDGLVWTSHPRIKGSVGFPDKYKDESFYLSDHFLGVAWKAMPADLSQPVLGKRVLDLMDDMENWGQQKYVLAEGDLFKILPQYELYGHMNINYLQLDSLPSFTDGWKPVLNALRKGKFFVTTGEILLPEFSVNGKRAGETLQLNGNGDASITLQVEWTFPLNFITIVSGDGDKVYRKKVDMTGTEAFGNKKFIFPVNLSNRTWVRVEVWDAATNGAFTQCVWLGRDPK